MAQDRRADFPYKASHRFARISVRKLRPILDLIRGKYADDALDILKYMPHRGARMIEQVLKSAMANAEDRGVRNVGDLVVADARGDGGPMFKRLMPRARGMAYMIRRRSCHITIGLADLETLLAGGPRPTAGRPSDRRRPGPDRRPTRRQRTPTPWARRSDRPGSASASWRTGGAAGTPPSTSSSDLLVEDFKIRKFIKSKYSYAGIPKIEIERTRDAVKVSCSPPGRASSSAARGPRSSSSRRSSRP